MTAYTLTAREMPWTPAEYHAERDHVNHSSLKTFSNSAELYRQIFVSGEREPDPATAEMKVGTATHAKLFQPERFDELVAIAPDIDRRSNANKAVWTAFESYNASKTIIKAADQGRVIRMAGAVMDHDMAGDLLSADGICERAIVWEDPETGLPLKALLDKRIPTGRIIIDLKTTDDPSPESWAWTVRKYGYHRQAAWYLDGAQAFYGGDWRFYHIVVSSEEPHDVAVYPVGEAYLRLGREQNRRNLAALKQCTDSGVWKHSWQIGVAPAIEPARWEM